MLKDARRDVVEVQDAAKPADATGYRLRQLRCTSANGAEYESQGQVRREAAHVAPG